MSIIDPAKAPAKIKGWLKTSAKEIDTQLELILALPNLPSQDPAFVLMEAMRYAVLGGGKRLRPALCLAACQACGGTKEQAYPAAVAIELLHAYTLVHDDLPAMDDDKERRGRPTVHVQYDEATAILVGDSLLSLAFASLANLEHGCSDALALLAQRSGHAELLAGQMLDLHWQKDSHQPKASEIKRLHEGKTGALFAAACQLGAIAAGANLKQSSAMASYGMNVGVAFQHADDLDDGDFPEHKAMSNERRIYLSKKAANQLQDLGEAGALLQDFAMWVGRAL